MRGFISISNRALLAILACLAASVPVGVRGQSATEVPEEESHDETPYTRYGEFDEEEEEAATTEFFQHGRFFGVSVGAGFEGVTGNRGLLYRGGIPAVSVKVHAWITLNLAVQMGFTTASHYYSTTTNSRNDVTISSLSADLKYYFDTRNLTDAITFAGPYIFAGMGGYSKNEYDVQRDLATTDGAVGFSGGLGLEFPIAMKKSYAFVEGRITSARFTDIGDDTFSSVGIDDLDGLFYNVTVGVLFTW